MSAIGDIIQLTILVIALTIGIIFYDINLNPWKEPHPLAGLQTDKLLIEFGYPVEIHELVTEDGYVLTLHRIPYGKGEKKHNVKKRPPVLMVHCLTCAAVDFITSGPNSSLAMLLADSGYDVWLLNDRGTTWSRKHINLDPDYDASQFWDFSFHEMGLYDVPESIDYILKNTTNEKLHYIGMSQGAVNFLIMLSEKPEYNRKVRHMSAIVPAATIIEPYGYVLRTLAYFRGIYKFLREYMGVYEQFSHHGRVADILRIICHKNSLFVQICIVCTEIMVGFNRKEINWDMLPVQFAVTPAGCATKQIEHFLQNIYTGNFSQFDYGTATNMEIYQQEYPPLYDLSKTKVPVAIYYSDGDWIINEKSVDALKKDLVNTKVTVYKVPDHRFHHNDFLYALHARELVYQNLVDEMKKY